MSAEGDSALDSQRLAQLERYWNCRLTTRGRKSGEERSVTIWFAFDGNEVVLAGSPENPHWRKNLSACEDVKLRIGSTLLHGRARPVDDAADAAAIREIFVRRYLAVRFSRLFGGYTRSTTVRVAIDRATPA